MTAPVATIRRFSASRNGESFRWRELVMWCPGCEMVHQVGLPPMFDERVPADRHTWTFDGNMERPTISPSILAYSTVHVCESEHGPVECVDPECTEKFHLLGVRVDDEILWSGATFSDDDQDLRVRGHNTPHTRNPGYGNCHSYVENGIWRFLDDSAHSLAGKSHEMVPLPEWIVNDD